jgi:hypothetical protein
MGAIALLKRLGRSFTELAAQAAQVALLPLSQRFLEIGRSPNFRGGRSGRSLAPVRAPWARSLTQRAELCATRAVRHTQNEAKEFTTACAGSWNKTGAHRGLRPRALSVLGCIRNEGLEVKWQL